MSPESLGTTGALVLLGIFLVIAGAYTWALWTVTGWAWDWVVGRLS